MNKKLLRVNAVCAMSVPIVFLFALLASGAQSKKGEFEIINNSDWDIHRLFLSPTAKARWGPDQLGDKMIKHGDSYTLHNIPCNHYDIKIIDEDGDDCVINDVTMCKDHTTWKVTNEILAQCEGWGR